MKKRVFSMLLALVMALSLLPTMAVAEGEPGPLEVTEDVTLNEHRAASTVTVAADKTLTIKREIELNVTTALTNSGTIVGEQDARIVICANAAVDGITLYNETGDSVWTDFTRDRTFISLDGRWVRFVDRATALEEALESYLFAYAGADADAIKTAMAKELTERRIGDAHAIGTDACALGEILNKNAAELKELITLSSSTSTDDSIIEDLPYYTYTITVEDIDLGAEGNQLLTVYGKVYVLPTDHDIVIKSFNGNGEVTYSKATLSDAMNATNSVYADFVFPEGDGWRGEPTFEVYGNGAWLNTIYNEDRGICAYHITQEHSGGLNTFPSGARLLVSNNQQTVTLSYSKDAAAWDFANANAYGVGTAANPATANVFYGADQITLTATDYANVAGEKAINKIIVLNLSENAVTVSGTTLSFHTDYDYVQLKITYNDSSEGYLDLYRVGLVINSTNTEGNPDAEHYGDRVSDELAARNSNWGTDAKTFTIWHGTDQSVRYAAAENTDEKVITATFYYDEAEGVTPSEWAVFDNNVATKYADLSRVNLFVTIDYKNGTKELKLIQASDAITRADKAVATENGGFIKSEWTTAGYAGQGSCHFYDDFVLWSGSEAEYANIKSVSAIVYNAGNDDTFGGVKVGSGTGVLWENN